MSNTAIIARFRKWLRLCWSPFVIPQRYEPARARPSATDPDIGMTDVTGRKGDSPRGISPRADRRAVAVQDLGLVLVPGGGGPVGVQHQGPALPVDRDLVVVGAQQHAVLGAGRAAVGLVPGVVHL